MIIIGIIIFIIGSALCLIATSYQSLILGRFLQGVGIAAPFILYFLIIIENYPIKRQQSLMGIMNGFSNAAIAFAPVIGSYITIYYHWQGNFIALLVFGIIVLSMTIIFVPHKKQEFHEERSSKISYWEIFNSRQLMLLITNLVLKSLPYYVFLSISSIVYVDGLGVSLSHYGYYQGAWALVFSVGSIIAVAVVNKYKSKNMLIFSVWITVVSFIAVGVVTILDCKNPLFIATAFTIFSVAEIIPSIVIYPLCINFIPEAKGKISSLLLVSRLILSSIFIQIAGYFYSGSFQNIGIIISIIIVFIIITSFLIIKNKEMMSRIDA